MAQPPPPQTPVTPTAPKFIRDTGVRRLLDDYQFDPTPYLKQAGIAYPTQSDLPSLMAWVHSLPPTEPFHWFGVIFAAEVAGVI